MNTPICVPLWQHRWQIIAHILSCLVLPRQSTWLHLLHAFFSFSLPMGFTQHHGSFLFFFWKRSGRSPTGYIKKIKSARTIIAISCGMNSCGIFFSYDMNSCGLFLLRYDRWAIFFQDYNCNILWYELNYTQLIAANKVVAKMDFSVKTISNQQLT